MFVPFGKWLTQCFPIHHYHHMIYLIVIKSQIMEKENKQSQSQLCWSKHYNQYISLLVNTKGKRKKILNTYLSDCFCIFLPLCGVCVSQWLHTPKASHLLIITQHITVNGLVETSYDVLCPSQNDHSPLPVHLKPPGTAHDIQLTLTHYHWKWTTVNTFMIAAQKPCMRTWWMIHHQNSFW